MEVKKVANNAGASLLAQIVNIITNLVLPPMIIAVYGSKINGLISSIKSIMAYVSLIGAGISISSTQSLYKPLAEKDHRTISGMINATNRMFLQAGSFFSVLALLTAFVYPCLVKDGIDYLTVVKLVMVMSIAGASEFFVVGKLTCLLYADQKAYITSSIQAAGLILSFIMAFVMIKANMSIVVVQLAASAVYVFRIVALSLYVKRNYRFLDPKCEPIRAAVEKKNDAFVHQLTGLVALNSQAIVLSTFVGLEAASIYSIYNLVLSGIHSICAQAVNAVAPFLGRTIALNKEDELRTEFNRVEYVYSLVLSFVFSVSSVMLVPFISIYVGDKYDINYIDYKVATLFIVVTFFNSIRLPAQAIINVAGHYKETRYQAIAEASICIALQLLLVKTIGIYGILIATAIALGWRCFDMIFYSNKYLIKQNNKTSILRMIKIPIVASMLVFINTVFIHINAGGYFSWIMWAVVFSFLSIMAILLLNFIMERKQLLELFAAISRYLLYKK